MLQESWSGEYIAKWYMTPWPEQIQRKIEMGRTVPTSDRAKNLGIHHSRAFNEGAKYVVQVRQSLLHLKQVELCEDNRTIDKLLRDVRRAFFAEVGGGCIQSHDGQFYS